MVNNYYQEHVSAGNIFREKQIDEILELVKNLQGKAAKERACFFRPDYTSLDNYSASIDKYRKGFRAMLGWPLTKDTSDCTNGAPEYIFVGEDSLGKIYRVLFPVLEGLKTYGILFLPHGEGPFPLVLTQHGGHGTPELCAGFFEASNYNDMTRRVLRRGAAVFSPQLMLWDKERFGPDYDRTNIDKQLKHLGSSITAVEIFKIIKSLDFLLERNDIDALRVGMIGLSYGGFYTLFTSAVDIRIKVAVSSCYVNNRIQYDWNDWTWFNSANTFLDSEICALICPRALYIEAATSDELFEIEGFKQEAVKAEYYYKKLNVAKQFKSKVFEGKHELCKEEDPINFLFENL